MTDHQPWPGYKMNLIDELDGFLEVHQARLKAIVGTQICQMWFVWSEPYSEWWVDAPVVLDFGGQHLEFQGCKFMCSVCWDSIRLQDPLDPGLVWVQQLPNYDLSQILGRRVESINLFTLARGERVRGLEFVLESGQAFSLFDNGDETGFHVGDDLPEMMTRVALGTSKMANKLRLIRLRVVEHIQMIANYEQLKNYPCPEEWIETFPFHLKSDSYIDAFKEGELKEIARYFGQLCDAGETLAVSAHLEVDELLKLPEWVKLRKFARRLLGTLDAESEGSEI